MSSNLIEQGLTTILDADYKAHPAYMGFAASAGIFVKAEALARFFKHLGLKKNFKVVYRRYRHGFTNDIKSRDQLMLLQNLKKDGAVAIRLSSNEMVGIKQGAEKYTRLIRAHLAAVPKEQRVANDTRFSIPRGEARALYDLAEQALRARGVFEVASTYKGAPMVLQKLILQIHSHDDFFFKNRFADVSIADPPTTYMHIDATVDSKKFIKCIVYLSEVGPDQGPFSYVLGSNNLKVGFWERIIRSSHDKSGLNEWDPATRKLFAALPAFLQRKSEFGNDLLPDSAYSKALLECEKKFTSQDGNMIFFDNYGIHRGGMVKTGERIILQIQLISKVW